MSENFLVDDIKKRLLLSNPYFNKILKASNLGVYFKPVQNWIPSERVFPYRKNLQDYILNYVRKLYGDNICDLIKEQLNSSFTVDTGPHLSLPRSMDKITDQNHVDLSFNTLSFQSVILSAAYHVSAQLDKKEIAHLTMSTSRIFPNNVNSAAYFQVFGKHDCVRLISNRWKDTPQTFIPPFDQETVSNIKDFIRKMEHINPWIHEMVDSVISIILDPAETLSEQVSRIHSYLLGNLLSESGIRQVTIDYEEISWNLISDLFEDENSLIYQIFSNRTLRNRFIELFSGIKTGWNSKEQPFDVVVEKNGVKKLSPMPADVFYDVKELAHLLRQGKILPKGVLQFFVFMIEGGMLPIGGMNQVVYCSMIKDRSISLLNELRQYERAEGLKEIPCSILSLSLAWATQKENPDRLFDYTHYLTERTRMSRSDLLSILNIPGEDALMLGSLVFFDFITGTKMDQEHEQAVYSYLKRRGHILSL